MWEPPPLGVLKCNVDTALFGEENKASFGFILRDHAGAFVAAGNGQLECIMEPTMAKAMSFKEALAWLKEQAYDYLIMEVDCKSLWLKLCAPSEDLSYLGWSSQRLKGSWIPLSILRLSI